MAAALAEIAEADRAAERAERGFIRGLHTAKTGETWESISNQEYGDASRVGDILAANAIEPGEAPTPGTTYIIPR